MAHDPPMYSTDPHPRKHIHVVILQTSLDIRGEYLLFQQIQTYPGLLRHKKQAKECISDTGDGYILFRGREHTHPPTEELLSIGSQLLVSDGRGRVYFWRK